MAVTGKDSKASVAPAVWLTYKSMLTGDSVVPVVPKYRVALRQFCNALVANWFEKGEVGVALLGMISELFGVRAHTLTPVKASVDVVAVMFNPPFSVQYPDDPALKLIAVPSLWTPTAVIVTVVAICQKNQSIIYMVYKRGFYRSFTHQHHAATWCSGT
jgi:hypothetical protein